MAFLAAVFVGLICIAPNIFFIFSLGDAYEGIPIAQIDNELDYLGRMHDGYYFNGKLDEIKIYNYALTSDQVKVDYNNGAAVGFR